MDQPDSAGPPPSAGPDRAERPERQELADLTGVEPGPVPYAGVEPRSHFAGAPQPSTPPTGGAYLPAVAAQPAGTAPYPGAHGPVPQPPELRLRRGGSRLGDFLLTSMAVGVFVLGSIAVAATGTGPAAALSVLASVVMSVAMFWRRTRPVASAVAVYAGALSHFLFGAQLLPADVLVLVALYSVTVHGPVWAGRAALGGSLLGAVLQSAAVSFSSGPGLTGIAGLDWALFPDGLLPFFFIGGLIGSMCLVAWALGLVRRSRLAHTETLLERAQRLEIERDQQAQIATAAERSRIAREMHDVVAHSLSVVIAQADGGRYAAAADPDAAVRALTTISETGRAALSDMRKILGVLRAPGSEHQAETTVPQPIDADLDSLVEQLRSSGLEVSLVRVGQARTLPPGLGLAVYRICQEGLTNVLKHGGPSASASVLLQWSPQRVVVQVDDTGRGAAAVSDGAGHGLVGMRERVHLFGGTLEAGPKQGGGFRVRAEIPLPGGTGAGGAPHGADAPLAPASWPPHPQNGAP